MHECALCGLTRGSEVACRHCGVYFCESHISPIEHNCQIIYEVIQEGQTTVVEPSSEESSDSSDDSQASKRVEDTRVQPASSKTSTEKTATANDPKDPPPERPDPGETAPPASADPTTQGGKEEKPKAESKHSTQSESPDKPVEKADRPAKRERKPDASKTPPPKPPTREKQPEPSATTKAPSRKEANRAKRPPKTTSSADTPSSRASLVAHIPSRKLLVACAVVLVFAGVAGAVTYDVMPFDADEFGVAQFDVDDYGVGSFLGLHDSAAPQHGVNEGEVEQGVLEAIDLERVEADVTPIRSDPQLAAVAQYHSADMRVYNYVGQESPEGETLDDRLELFDYECDTVGGILLLTFYDQDVSYNDGIERFESEDELAHGIVQTWLSSTEHREFILDPQWESMAVGVRINDDGAVYVSLLACNQS